VTAARAGLRATGPEARSGATGSDWPEAVLHSCETETFPDVPWVVRGARPPCTDIPIRGDGACRARTGDPQLAKPSGGDSGEGGSDPERPRLAGDSAEDEPALAGADPGGSDRAVGQAFGWYRALGAWAVTDGGRGSRHPRGWPTSTDYVRTRSETDVTETGGAHWHD